MKLIELVQRIDKIDEDLIIFQERKDDIDSDIELAYEDDAPDGVLSFKGKEYHYMIEVFLAKEFITDWVSSLDFKPTETEIASRLYEYIINDA